MKVGAKASNNHAAHGLHSGVTYFGQEQTLKNTSLSILKSFFFASSNRLVDVGSMNLARACGRSAFCPESFVT